MGTNIDRYFHHLSIARCSLVDLLHGIFEKIKSRLAAKVGKLRDMLHRALLMQTEFRKKGKLLKNLIICLAFQISALGFFHGSTEYERIAQFCHGTSEMSVKKISPHCKTRKKTGGTGNSFTALVFPWAEVGTRKVVQSHREVLLITWL